MWTRFLYSTGIKKRHGWPVLYLRNGFMSFSYIQLLINLLLVLCLGVSLLLNFINFPLLIFCLHFYLCLFFYCSPTYWVYCYFIGVLYSWLFIYGPRAVSYTHLDVYKRQPRRIVSKKTPILCWFSRCVKYLCQVWLKSVQWFRRRCGSCLLYTSSTGKILN